MNIEIIQPDFCLDNEKGRLVQLVHDGWKQFNVLISPQGSNRGGHFHKINRECFYVIEGKMKLIIGDKKNELIKQFGPGDFFVIPPYTLHSLAFEEKTILVALYDIGIERENGEKDIYTY